MRISASGNQNSLIKLTSTGIQLSVFSPTKICYRFMQHSYIDESIYSLACKVDDRLLFMFFKMHCLVNNAWNGLQNIDQTTKIMGKKIVRQW